jgi:hypothetical protein
MLIWDGPRNGSINGVPFRYVDADYAKARTTLDEIIVLKPKASRGGHSGRLVRRA